MIAGTRSCTESQWGVVRCLSWKSNNSIRRLIHGERGYLLGHVKKQDHLKDRVIGRHWRDMASSVVLVVSPQVDHNTVLPVETINIHRAVMHIGRKPNHLDGSTVAKSCLSHSETSCGSSEHRRVTVAPTSSNNLATCPRWRPLHGYR